MVIFRDGDGEVDRSFSVDNKVKSKQRSGTIFES